MEIISIPNPLSPGRQGRAGSSDLTWAAASKPPTPREVRCSAALLSTTCPIHVAGEGRAAMRAERNGQNGKNHWWNRNLTLTDDRIRTRPPKAGRSGMGADLRSVPARAAMAGGKETRRSVPDLQRPRNVVLLRPLFT